MRNRAAFLSYASQDAEPAQRICEALRAAGVEVWFDQSELRGGDAWDASIRRQIKDCSLFIPLVSRNTDARGEGYFRLEWKLAVARSQLMADDEAFLLPVVVDDTSEPAARVPEAFRERQWTRLRDEPGIRAFADRVRRLLEAPAEPPGQVAAASPRQAAAEPAVASARVAVLAFANLSDDRENEYFSDGISEELLTVLQKIRGLQVLARSSSFAFKGTSATAQEIGQKLGVAHLVEGSVRKAGRSVRIAARLVRAEDGEQLWSEAYTRDLDDVFAVQSALAQTIVEQLRDRLGAAVGGPARAEVRSQVESALRGGTRNAESHQLYLQALFHLHQFSLPAARRAREFLERALAIDPGFALGWAALARVGLQFGGFGDNRPEFEAGWTLAREAADRALALDPDLASAHVARAGVQLWHDFDWKAGKESARRAHALAPGDPEALKAAAMFAHATGNPHEASEKLEQVVARDPMNAETRALIGWALDAAGRPEEAAVHFRRITELSADAPWGHAGVGLTLLSRGRAAEAVEEAGRESTEWARLTVQAMALWELGRRADSDAALAQLTRGFSDVAAVQVAQNYAHRRDNDAAFEWLERALIQRDAGLAWIKPDRTFARLRDDPRWQAFLGKLGLSDSQLGQAS